MRETLPDRKEAELRALLLSIATLQEEIRTKQAALDTLLANAVGKAVPGEYLIDDYRVVIGGGDGVCGTHVKHTAKLKRL